jgi:hypothetical protein
MKTTKLGKSGPEVSKIGLGCMSMGNSGMYGASADDEGVRTIQEAVDRGVTLIDTGDFYAMGENEMLVGRALAGGRRDKVQLSVKFGGMRDPGGAFIGLDMRPVAVKNFLASSCAGLRPRRGRQAPHPRRARRARAASPAERLQGQPLRRGANGAPRQREVSGEPYFASEISPRIGSAT